MKKSTIICVCIAAIVSGCVEEGANDPSVTKIDGEYTFLSNSSSGFRVLVPNDFSPVKLRTDFGDYCKKYNRVTRSVKLERDDQGRRVVVGDCIR